jgi:signal transduction histidine kinase
MTLPICGRRGPLGTVLFLRTGPGSSYDRHDLALATELTDRAALAIENALLYDEAQRAVQLRDELQRIVAHDLRDPLNAISLSTGLIARLVESDARPILERAISNQREAISAMKGLITDLLCAAKLESGRLAIEVELISCEELLRGMVDLYAMSAASHGVELRHEVPEDVPPACADPARLRQVFGNLLGNALRHTPAGGSVQLGVQVTGELLEFTVSDTGPGIAEEDRARIFERHWQKSGGSAGLGLWIARELVGLHDGEIWVSSVVDEGSTFHFTVPLQNESCEAA